jgi:hypothetical protein
MPQIFSSDELFDLNKLNVDAEKTSKTLKDLRNEIKSSKEAMLNAAEGSDEYKAALKKAADTALELREMQQKVRWSSADLGDVMSNTSKVLTGVAGGFAAVQGVMGLFNTESKELEKAMLKVQSALAIVAGVAQIDDAIKGLQRMLILINSTAIAKKAAAAAQWLWNIAMNANPIILLATGILAATAAIWGIVKAFKSNNDELEINNQLLEKNKKAREVYTREAERYVKTMVAAGATEDEVLYKQLEFTKIERERLQNEIKRLENRKKLSDEEKKALDENKTNLQKLLYQEEDIQDAINNYIIKNKRETLQKIKEENDKNYEKSLEDNKKNNEEEKKLRDKSLEDNKKDNQTLENLKDSYLSKSKLLTQKNSDDELEIIKNQKYEENLIWYKSEYQKIELLIENIKKRKGITEKEKEQLIKDAEDTAQILLSTYIKANESTNSEDEAKREEEKANKEKEILDNKLILIETYLMDKFYLEQGWLSDSENNQYNYEKNSLEANKKYLEDKIKQEKDYEAKHQNAEKNSLKSQNALTKVKIDLMNLELNHKKIQIQSTSELLGNAAAIFGKNTVAFKALSIAEATINTYLSATAAYKSMLSIPVAGPALGAAAAIAAIATGLKNVQAIIATEVPGASDTSSSSASSISASTPTPPPITQNISATRQILTDTEQSQELQPVRVYVVESDITEAQNRTKTIVSESVL